MARDFVSELPFDQNTDCRANGVLSVLNVVERVLRLFNLAKAAVQLAQVAPLTYHYESQERGGNGSVTLAVV